MCNVPLIDVRAESEFVSAHVPGAASFPLEELPARVHELPPKRQRLRVTDADPNRAQAAMEFLTARGHPVKIEPFDAAALTDSGPSTVRLWQPSPFLVEALDWIERDLSKHLVAQPPSAVFDQRSKAFCAIDVACGTGRDSVYLALRGLGVTAIDVLPDALERAENLARRSGVKLTTIVHDLERDDSLPPNPPANVLTVFRYLHRPLFPALAAAVDPGGYVIYETFHERNGQTGQRPQNPDHLLKTGELPTHFPNFEILITRDAWERDGRFFSSLLARKPINVR